MDREKEEPRHWMANLTPVPPLHPMERGPGGEVERPPQPHPRSPSPSDSPRCRAVAAGEEGARGEGSRLDTRRNLCKKTTIPDTCIQRANESPGFRAKPQDGAASRRAGYIYPKICHFRADFPVWNLQVRNTNRESCHVLREAYGVHPAGRRFRPSGTAPKREQAPRTPNASRGSATVGLLNDVASWLLWFRLRRPGDSAPYLWTSRYLGNTP